MFDYSCGLYNINNVAIKNAALQDFVQTLRRADFQVPTLGDRDCRGICIEIDYSGGPRV